MLIVDAQVHTWAAGPSAMADGPSHLAQKPYPVTQDLVLAGMREAGVDRIVIVRPAPFPWWIESRSAAIPIALECGAPIFVTEETFRQAGVEVLSAGRELPELETIHAQAVAEGRAEPDQVPREWRSFRSLARNEAKWLRPRAGRGVAEGAR